MTIYFLVPLTIGGVAAWIGSEEPSWSQGCLGVGLSQPRAYRSADAAFEAWLDEGDEPPVGMWERSHEIRETLGSASWHSVGFKTRMSEDFWSVTVSTGGLIILPDGRMRRLRRDQWTVSGGCVR